MREAAKPLMEWLQKNTHPHCECQVTSATAKLVEDIAFIIVPEFVGK